MSWFFGRSSAPKIEKALGLQEEKELEDINLAARNLVRHMMKSNIPKLKATLEKISKDNLLNILIETKVEHAYGIDINNSPLSYACENCTREICELVFNYISDDEWFTKHDTYGWTAIHSAAINQTDDILQLLYDRNEKFVQENINIQTECSETTPLYYACRFSRKACVDWLLKKGADFNIKNSNGERPIHYAADGGDPDIFKLIFEKYKDEEMNKLKKDYQNKQVIDDGEQLETVKCINDTDDTETESDKKLEELILKNLKDAKKELGEDNLFIKDNESEIPLFYAARGLNLECIETILNYQGLADATVRNNNCDTALHFICNNISEDALLKKVKENGMLQEKVAAAKEMYPLKDYEKDTDLKRAVENEVCEEYYTKKLASILKANALLGVKNEAGNKPLDWMKNETVKLLLDQHIEKHKLSNEKEGTSKKDKYKLVITNFFGHHASGSDMKNILAIANSKKHEDLALHPLCQSIISVKWQKMEKYFLLKALFFIPLVVILTIYSVVLEANQSSEGNNTESSMKNGEQISHLWLAAYCLLLIQVLFGSLSIFVLFGPFIKESKAYTTNISTKHVMRLLEFYGNELLWSDWPEYLLWICSFLLLHGFIPPILVVVVAWFSLFLVCSKHPSILPFRYIFVKILFRYIKFLIFAFGLIAGFGMGFYFLLSNCKSDDGKEPCVGGAFEKVKLMALKVPSMMMGEITYDEFPFEHAYPWLYILFSAFIFLITCCLFNMMNGLAVNLTDELMKKSEIFKTIAQCEMIFEFEVLLKEVSSWLKWFGLSEISFFSPIWFDEIYVSPSSGECTDDICKGYKLCRSIVNKAKEIGSFVDKPHKDDDDDDSDSNGEGPKIMVSDDSGNQLVAIDANNVYTSSSRCQSVEDLQKVEQSEDPPHLKP